MNSIERVKAAIAHEAVDQVPLGFYCADYDTVEAVLGRKTFVRNKIAIQVAYWQGRRDEVVESLKVDTVEFYRKLDCVDIILTKECPVVPPAGYRPEDPPRQIEPNKWRDSRGRVWLGVPEVNEIQLVHDPTPPKSDWTVEDFTEPLPVEPPDPSRYEAIDHLLNALGAERYIPCIAPTVGVEKRGGFENGLMMHALQPDVVRAANQQMADLCDAMDSYNIRPGSTGVMFDNDMAGTNGPLISPAMFRELVLPFFAQRARHVKRQRDQLILHNCGNNIPLMEMFIEAGVDCYQSLQTTAGMDVGRLKKQFGGRMAFWGGVGVEVLIQGGPEDVRREVRAAMQRGAPGGGFILGPSHSIAKNTTYENFMAMLDEFVKLRDKF